MKLLNNISTYVFAALISFFSLESFSMNLAQEIPDDILFIELYNFQKQARKELDYFFQTFMPNDYNVWKQFSESTDFPRKTQEVLLQQGRAIFLKEFRAQSEKIQAWKNHFGYNTENPLKQEHFERRISFFYNYNSNVIFKIWKRYKETTYFNSLVTRFFNENSEPVLNTIPTFFRKLIIEAMDYSNDLQPLIEQSSFLKKIKDPYPSIWNQLLALKPERKWGDIPHSIRLEHSVDPITHITKIIDTIPDGIVHYAHLQPEQLDNFHKNVLNSFWDSSNGPISKLYYTHEGITLSLSAFRLLYGKVYFGEDAKDDDEMMRSYNELLQLPSMISLEDFLRYTHKYPCKDLQSHDIGIHSHLSIRQRILQGYFHKNPKEFYRIHEAHVGRHKDNDHILLAMVQKLQDQLNMLYTKSVQKQAPKTVPQKLVSQEESEAKLIFRNYHEKYKNYCQKLWKEFISLCGEDWNQAIEKFSDLLIDNSNKLDPIRNIAQEWGDGLDATLLMKVRRDYFLQSTSDDFFAAWEQYLDADTILKQLQIISSINKTLSSKSAFELNSIIFSFSDMFTHKGFDDDLQQKLMQLSFLKIPLNPQPSCDESPFATSLQASLLGTKLNDQILSTIKNQHISMSQQAPDLPINDLTQPMENSDAADIFVEKKIMVDIEASLKKQFKKELDYTHKIFTTDLTLENMMTQLEQLTSSLGFKNHPYLDIAQSYSPMLKVALTSWRKKSQKAFLLNIAHLPQEDKTKALEQFQAVQTLYNALLSNAKDYTFFYQRLMDQGTCEFIKKDFNLLTMKKKNLLFFREMSLPEFSSIGHFYPLNIYQLKRTVNKLTTIKEEKEFFYRNFSFSKENIETYLKAVKEMLTKLNNSYFYAKKHLNQVRKPTNI